MSWHIFYIYTVLICAWLKHNVLCSCSTNNWYTPRMCVWNWHIKCWDFLSSVTTPGKFSRIYKIINWANFEWERDFRYFVETIWHEECTKLAIRVTTKLPLLPTWWFVGDLYLYITWGLSGRERGRIWTVYTAYKNLRIFRSLKTG